VLADFEAGAVTLRTRGGHDCTTWFPEITRALTRYRGGPGCGWRDLFCCTRFVSWFLRYRDRLKETSSRCGSGGGWLREEVNSLLDNLADAASLKLALHEQVKELQAEAVQQDPKVRRFASS